MTSFMRGIVAYAEEKVKWNAVADDKASLSVAHANGRLARRRAFVFADAAADAALCDHVRALKRDGLSRVVSDVERVQLDSFGRERAHFLAHDARRVLGPRQTPVAVDICLADHLLALDFEREIRNRPAGTDLAARVARVIAIAQARDERGRPHAVEAGFPQRRLQTRGRADLEAFAATDALGKERIFLRAGRADEALITSKRFWSKGIHGSRDEARAQRGNRLPSARIGPDRQGVTNPPFYIYL
jgi:hypothetical protein